MAIGNGNRTEWSPIRSVIIEVITKSDDRAAINHKNYNFQERKNTKVRKGKIYIKSFYTVSMVIG